MEFIQIFNSGNLCYWDTAFNFIMAFSIVFGIRTFRLTSRQNNFNSVKACNDMFRAIVRKQQKLKQSKGNSQIDKHQILFRDHMGLVNEELFYIRQGILPKSIALEWLAEMPKRVPVYDKDGNMLNLELLREGENSYLVINHFSMVEDRMNYFGGVKRAFTINKQFSFFSSNWDVQKMKFSRYLYRKIRKPWFLRFSL